MYNLGINHEAKKQGYMNVWVEGIAKRGSCLLNFILELCKNWEEIVLRSDNCGGQNRNSIIIALLLSLVNSNLIGTKII